MTNKLREQFDEMVVFKDLKGMSFLKTLKLPSFLRDWVLKKFEDEDGNFDTQDLLDFVNKYMPRKEEWISIKERIVTSYEHVKLLTKINVDISIKTARKLSLNLIFGTLLRMSLSKALTHGELLNLGIAHRMIR